MVRGLTRPLIGHISTPLGFIQIAGIVVNKTSFDELIVKVFYVNVKPFVFGIDVHLYVGRSGGG